MKTCEQCGEPFVSNDRGPLAKTCSYQCEEYRRYLRGRRKRQADKQQKKARSLTATAHRKGQLVSPKQCEDCGERTYVLAHHPDYSKPLLIHWVCRACHGKRHKGDIPLSWEALKLKHRKEELAHLLRAFNRAEWNLRRAAVLLEMVPSSLQRVIGRHPELVRIWAATSLKVGRPPNNAE
jgi:hypothetical protein